MLILHVPEDKGAARDISRTGGTIPHIRTEACIADDHAASALATEKSHSDPCLRGLDKEHTSPANSASGTTDASNGDVVFMSASADDQHSLIDVAPSRSASPSGAFTQGSNAGRQQEAPLVALQDAGWRGVQTRALADRPHKLQAWFGVDAFLTLIPSSYSRRILNEQVGFGHCPTSATNQQRKQSRCLPSMLSPAMSMLVSKLRSLCSSVTQCWCAAGGQRAEECVGCGARVHRVSLACFCAHARPAAGCLLGSGSHLPGQLGFPGD